jgi:hypothetical protein
MVDEDGTRLAVGERRNSRKDAEIAKLENSDSELFSSRPFDSTLWFFLAPLAILAREIFRKSG